MQGKAYAVINRKYLGDDTPYVYRTTDYGESWQQLTSGIPKDSPARVISEDAEREGLLFLGTEIGLHISFDDGNLWHPFQNNLPKVPITDLKIYRDNLNIATMGRSFWILRDISVLRQHNNLSSKKPFIYKPNDTFDETLSIYFTSQENVSDSVSFSFENSNGIIIHEKTLALSKVPKGEFDVRRIEWDLRHYMGR